MKKLIASLFVSGRHQPMYHVESATRRINRQLMVDLKKKIKLIERQEAQAARRQHGLVSRFLIRLGGQNESV